MAEMTEEQKMQAAEMATKDAKSRLKNNVKKMKKKKKQIVGKVDVPEMGPGTPPSNEDK